MHGACSTGSFLSWHLNFQVMQQAMARLNRIGQREPVDWWLLKVKGSYHDHIERFNFTRYTGESLYCFLFRQGLELSTSIGI